ncbi:hypothetical protein LCGC14_1143490 [marine sediment metagenome]|uniref:Uncharacterized protein n=1 Tax=marine sediment metagenome TaxID=412755 RepID=A0A0F9MKM7_9ZZZZ
MLSAEQDIKLVEVVVKNPVLSMSVIACTIDIHMKMPKELINTIIEGYKSINSPIAKNSVMFLEWILALKEIEEMKNED